jgi:hypothetical protein
VASSTIRLRLATHGTSKIGIGLTSNTCSMEQ